MKIKLFESDYEKIIAFAKSELPNEACGLIAGTEIFKDGKLVERNIQRVYFLTNEDHSPEHFSMDPQKQLKAVKDMRAGGLKMLGNWHSHPETPSRPSQEDIRLSFDINATYMILSLQDKDSPVLKAFHTDKKNDCYSAEDLEIIR